MTPSSKDHVLKTHREEAGSARELAQRGSEPLAVPDTPANAESARNEFERYPALASWMLRLGNTPGLMSLGDWMVFCGAVNVALKQAAKAGSPS